MKEMMIASLTRLAFGLLCALLLGLASQTAVHADCPTPLPNIQPTRLTIQIQTLEDTRTVSLTDPNLIIQLYDTIYELPALPANPICTLDYGPQYVLTFQQYNQSQLVVKAERYGCRRVTIDDQAVHYHGTNEFWTLLDQAIAAATPIPSVK